MVQLYFLTQYSSVSISTGLSSTRPLFNSRRVLVFRKFLLFCFCFVSSVPKFERRSRPYSGLYSKFQTQMIPMWKIMKESSTYVWYQASAARKTKSSLYWDFTQRRILVAYRRYGNSLSGPNLKGRAVQEECLILYILRGQLTPEDGTR